MAAAAASCTSNMAGVSAEYLGGLTQKRAYVAVSVACTDAAMPHVDLSHSTIGTVTLAGPPPPARRAMMQAE